MAVKRSDKRQPSQRKDILGVLYSYIVNRLLVFDHKTIIKKGK